MNAAWHNVSRREPCPVCGKPDWCAISNDGIVCVCRRVESAHPTSGGGWIHRLKECPRDVAFTRSPAAPSPTIDAARVFGALPCGPAQEGLHAHLAEHLGVDAAAFRALDVRPDPFSGAAAFPLRDARGAITGIRFRETETGRKWSLRGGRDGLFLPAALNADARYPHDELVICEGASDTAAALACGLSAVGRSSCTGGAEILREFCRLHSVRYATIVADADAPGQEGATRLGECLGLVHRIVVPPEPHKDLRAWVTTAQPGKDGVRKFFHFFEWKNYPFSKPSR